MTGHKPDFACFKQEIWPITFFGEKNQNLENEIFFGTVYPPLGVSKLNTSRVPPPWAPEEGKRRIRTGDLHSAAENRPVCGRHLRNPTKTSTLPLVSNRRGELAPQPCTLPLASNRRAELAPRPCTSPLASNQRGELAPNQCTTPLASNQRAELAPKPCTLPLVSKERAKPAPSRVPPLCSNRRAQSRAGSKLCTPPLAYKQRADV